LPIKRDVQLILRDQPFEIQQGSPQGLVDQDAPGMGSDFPVETGYPLPEFPCADPFGGETFCQLSDDGLDTATHRYPVSHQG